MTTHDEALREQFRAACLDLLPALGFGEPGQNVHVADLIDERLWAVVEPLARQVERVEAVCNEAEKNADTYKSACIVTTGKIRAALSATDSGSAEL